MTVKLHSAWLLHSRPYKETSVITDFLVKDYGRLAVVVKGARGHRSARAALLQPFSCVMLGWRGKGELKTLHMIEPLQGFQLLGSHLYSGFYVNELILRSIISGQWVEGLFELYSFVISQLSEKMPIQPVLRLFELQLLQLTGYLPSFNYDAQSGESLNSDNFYLFQPSMGFIAITDNAREVYNRHSVFHGQVLKALAARDFSDKLHYYDFKRFSRQALVVLIGEKPLKSRELFVRTKKDYARA